MNLLWCDHIFRLIEACARTQKTRDEITTAKWNVKSQNRNLQFSINCDLIDSSNSLVLLSTSYLHLALARDLRDFNQLVVNFQFIFSLLLFLRFILRCLLLPLDVPVYMPEQLNFNRSIWVRRNNVEFAKLYFLFIGEILYGAINIYRRALYAESTCEIATRESNAMWSKFNIAIRHLLLFNVDFIDAEIKH